MANTLDILLIEDNEKHLADAQAEVQRRISAGEELKVDFSGVYKQVLGLMKSKRYDGIITDVFFPASNDPGVPGKIPAGWDSGWRCDCYDLLENFGVNYPRGRHWTDFEGKIVEAADQWMAGHSMHPTGVLVVDRAIKAGIPIVMCTDTHHHGYQTQPVFAWASTKGVKMVDSYTENEGSASFKNWKMAFDELMSAIKQKE